MILSCALAATISACNNNNDKSVAERTVFIEKTGMDSTIKPGDDFYHFVNGGWEKNAAIPDDQVGWGPFYSMIDENDKKLKGILAETAAGNNAKGTPEQKVGDYYASGMDSAAIEKASATPLKPMLDRIDALKDYKDMMNMIADANAKGKVGLVRMIVHSDQKNSIKNIAVFRQAGLSLPEKEYYTRNDSATIAARNGLLQYVTRMFVLTGSDSATAAKNGAIVLALETEISKSHRTQVELRDVQANYNKMSLGEMESREPNIGWKNFFDKMGVKADSINIAQPGYYMALNMLLPVHSMNEWKIKLKYDYISANAGLLSKDFVDADFAFQKIMNGQKKDIDRWRKMVINVDNGLGELLGQLYVKKYFTEAAKQKMDELVNNLQKAFETRIQHLDWMSDVTKQKAIVKLNAFMKKIGFPSKWKTYDDVNIDKLDFFANAKSVEAHMKKEAISKIGKEVDRTEWGMTTPTVNAYYNATFNEIVFPAGILQYPNFDVNADDAMNYGAIGAVIGHEMTHGFDDQGSQYDETGNMKNWWAKEDSTKFASKTAAVVKEYDAFRVLDNLPVNGKLTLGENIADIGGIAIAYDAFKLTKQGKDTAKIDGLTADQRFFIAYAISWREIDRPEMQRVWINTDPHSPVIFRVNGPLSNFTPFYQTFGVKEGDKMYIKPEDRANIW